MPAGASPEGTLPWAEMMNDATTVVLCYSGPPVTHSVLQRLLTFQRTPLLAMILASDLGAVGRTGLSCFLKILTG